MAGGEFAHLSGADDENVFSLQRAEDFLCQLHRDRCDRDRRRSDGSLTAHPLGDGEGATEQLVELSADCAYSARRGISFLDLPENLRFPDDHRIQAGGHAEEMPDRLFLAKLVEMRVEFFGRQMKVIVQ